MEPKTISIVVIIIVLILLFIAIHYKIKTDKKTKSLLVNSPVPKEKKTFLETPSAVLAIITVVGATIVLFGIGEGLGSFIKIKGNIGEAIPYILYDIVIACCCYLIVKQNPGSIWYVPVICNVLGLISAIVEPNFWITTMWILICGGWVLSIVASIIGARMGKQKVISDDL